jgi:predicted transglutaminase-like cysteine proteinase
MSTNNIYRRNELMNFRMITLSTIAWAAAGALLVAPSLAQDSADAKVKPQAKVAPGDVAIPACLEKLTLTQQQQEQIKQIVRDYNADLAFVWKQFGTRYLETVRTEAL